MVEHFYMRQQHSHFDSVTSNCERDILPGASSDNSTWLLSSIVLQGVHSNSAVRAVFLFERVAVRFQMTTVVHQLIERIRKWIDVKVRRHQRTVVQMNFQVSPATEICLRMPAYKKNNENLLKHPRMVFSLNSQKIIANAIWSFLAIKYIQCYISRIRRNMIYTFFITMDKKTTRIGLKSWGLLNHWV